MTPAPIPSGLNVRRRTLFNDLIAGMINAVITIPNGLGGSILANDNPMHGLYSLIIGTAAALAIAVIRTALEGRTLQKELPGYRDHARRVRYRLCP
jgi:MFS superfamily sulfate permease-like transporter